MMCQHCQTNAGRTTAGAECCELRRLANAPVHVIQAHTARMNYEQREALRPILAAERKRLRELRSPT